MTLRFGVLAPKLSEQVIGLPESFDEKVRSVITLKINGILTDSEATKALGRIGKQVMKWMEEHERIG